MRSALARPAALTAVVMSLTVMLAAGTANASGSHSQIQGSGSSWSANAVNQWIADVQQNGLQVVFTANGSAQGRQDFAYKTTDFAVSDIGYQGVDPGTGQNDTSLGRAFAYLPIVAGGTAFPYNLKIGNQQVKNLRLSGKTLALIFTNHITNWNDPEIKADNNGRSLPALRIIPVVHSEGSGSTAQLTQYLNTDYQSIWKPFNNGLGSFTEYFPRAGSQIAQNGSDGVMNFISSAAANGSIGYDEYSYALSAGFPVVNVENSAGYFTAPDQYNVAVALTQALINSNPASPNYLLQDLHKVYVYADPRTYPLSSYSYMLVPTASSDSRMTTAKRQTLADYLYYAVCQGQAEMGPIGYSPLPINLVQASFAQTAKLHTADPGVNLTSENVANCHNPTFVAGQPTRNYLAEIAPKPPLCAKVGQGPCSGSQGIANGNPNGGHAPSSGGTSGSSGSKTKPTAAVSAGASSSGTVNSITGQTQTSDQSQAGANAALAASPTVLSGDQSSNMTGVLASLAAIELVLLLVLPPVLYRRFGRPKGVQS
jgi:phosphate ABC transporter phosphate-binding protein